MAISINWSTRVIFVPKAYLLPLGGRDYRLDINEFRRDLKKLEVTEEGMSSPDTHRHNTIVTLSGITFARVVEVVNGYTVEFESTGTPYRVQGYGANHNISDVQVINDVSMSINLTAGLVVVSSDGGSSGTAPTAAQIAAAVRKESLMGQQDPGTIGSALQDTAARVAGSL